MKQSENMWSPRFLMVVSASLLSFLVLGAAARPADGPVRQDQPEEYQAEVTGYCPCRKCCGPNARGITASGKKVAVGMVAADRSLPFGTKVYIEGFGYFTVEDRGGAIRGKKFDIFRSTHAEALEVGRSKRMVKVWRTR